MMRFQEKLREFFVPFVVEEQIVGYVHKKLVQMNGYVERDGKKYLWLAKRSIVKPTFPRKLDEMVAGGQVSSIVFVFMHDQLEKQSLLKIVIISTSLRTTLVGNCIQWTMCIYMYILIHFCF
ncbi:uncharacterized protein [Primulina huaijiensis]|uniref:uncharacterized protein isoform X2 n=1 Tax=Primulina huaijiensis TaxID=1492673 RepID=UPI003CC73A5C